MHMFFCFVKKYMLHFHMLYSRLEICVAAKEAVFFMRGFGSAFFLFERRTESCSLGFKVTMHIHKNPPTE